MDQRWAAYLKEYVEQHHTGFSMRDTFVYKKCDRYEKLYEKQYTLIIKHDPLMPIN